MIETQQLTAEEADILEFIRVAMLRPEQISALLPQLIQSLITDSAHHSNVERMAKERILSDEYLIKYIPKIQNLFSHEEIRRLIQFYRDPAIKKYFEHGGPIGAGIYSSFKEVVQSCSHLR